MGGGLSLPADLTNDDVDVNDNLAAPLLVKAAPQRIEMSGE